MCVRLVVIQGKPAGREIRLGPGEYFLGRGPECQLRFASDWADYVDWSLERLSATPGMTWTGEQAADGRTAPADHITTRYEEKRLGDCEPVFLDFVRR